MSNKPFNKHCFQQAADDPGAWWLTAWKLKRAADELVLYDEIGQPVEREGSKDREKKFLWPVHRMLMGLAFENLLKGSLIAQKKHLATNGTRLNKTFITHKLEKLLDLFDSGSFSASSDERKLLTQLEVYVVWMGRYPMPLSADAHDLPHYGSDEAQLEQKLWERLSNYLADNGWKKDADGKHVSMKSFGT